MNILTDLFQFLRKPDFVSIQDNAGNKIKILFTLFLCLLVIMFGMNVVVRILQVIVTNISLTFSTAGQATQISCNIQNDNKTCVNANIYSI